MVDRESVSQILIFLHLSDIHFSKRCGSTYDPDLDLRRELVTDAFRVKEQVKFCSGILVSGDIAFGGKPDEYKIAGGWLREVSKTLDCPEEAVWVVPGNHDIDRDVIKKSGIIQDKHERLRTGNLEIEIRRLHDDPEAFEAVHRPLAAYVTFAGGYECIPKAGCLFWEDVVPLNDGSKLRIRGCNSAFVSGENDDENAKRLVVGRSQMLPPNEDGVTNLLMCHHPLDWLYDRDALKDNLKARTRVVLFGHKHVQRLELADTTLLVSTGAVHPDRNEGKWEPRYNFLGLSVVTQAEQRHLRVELWPRIWDDVNKVFKAEYDDKGSDRREFHIPLPPWQSLPKAEAEPDGIPGSTTEVTEEGKIVNPKRRLVYRFHALPYVRRLEVLTKLKLVAEGDQDLKEEERNPLYFRRAEENGILDQLWTAVEQQHGVDLPGENPFTRRP